MLDIPVIIAAAGMGKRLGRGIPKCLVCVNDIPILDYQLDMLKNVKDVRIVTGYLADRVVARAKKKRPDIIIFRNDEFADTATLQSLSIAAQDISGYCLCLDGDMLIAETDFRLFMKRCKRGSPCMAIADEIGEDPVYALVQRENDLNLTLSVNGFSRTTTSPYEWANMAFLPADWLREKKQWGMSPVFGLLEKHLPLPAFLLRRLEVDTPEDLLRAENALHHNPIWKKLREIQA